MENDLEIEFKFHVHNFDFVAKYLKPSSYGADISPFSTKNLPKQNYKIPEKDLAEYRKITGHILADNKLTISLVTKDFMSKILSKDSVYNTISMKSHMRQTMLKGKEYIHKMGYWDKYLDYLRKNL